MEKGWSFQQMALENWTSIYQKMNVDTDFILFTKINSKWVIDLNITGKTIKLQEDNIGEMQIKLGLEMIF